MVVLKDWVGVSRRMARRLGSVGQLRRWDVEECH
jgi:hypothetical protein